MDRIVRSTVAATGGRQEEERRPFSAYAERANIVLLGDPGAGKTHLFREAAFASAGRYVTARAFLATPPRASGEILFIDGLDERRAGRSDRDTVDALVGKLFAAEPSKVRISCRAADWLGESDLVSLRPYFEQSGEPAVLGLKRLSQDEQLVVLAAQGMDADAAGAFLQEAEGRGLGDFLENPQNLIMLLRAVRSGQWPENRKALFELSTKLMLQEADPEHARAGAGVFSVAELRPLAGAVFAARLIGDIEAVSLADQEGTPSIPSYRSLGFLPADKLRAVLGRRVFVTGPAPETVDYAHRTTAEYLGAAWLADLVRSGFPFARLQALMGVDGHPAPELRGLHAWLSVHLPEHADRLIDADPYGVLTYGDAASLTRSACELLIGALAQLSQTDPWFRSENFESPAIGALSRADMVGAFRAVMHSAEAGFGVRSIVVEALEAGAPQPALKEDLAAVLERTGATYRERAHALGALLRMGKDGEDAVVDAYRCRLGGDADGLRLRTEIVFKLYGRPFGVDEVAGLLNTILASDEELVSGALWFLSDVMPPRDIAMVLDRIEPADRDGPRDTVERRNIWEVASFFERGLLRVWNCPELFEPARALAWLRKRFGFRDTYSGNRDGLREALRAQPARLMAMTRHFFATMPLNDQRWYQVHQFRQYLFHEISGDDFVDAIMAELAVSPRGSEREAFLYEVAFTLTHGASAQHGQVEFDRLFAMADTREDLVPVRDASVSARLPANYFDHRRRRDDDDEPFDQEQQRRDFERDSELIRTGAHIGWLTWCGKIYFSMFSDVDANATPYARLETILGTANATIALEGLRALLTRDDLPDLNDVVTLAARQRIYDWWFGLLAGMSEEYRRDGNLGAFPDGLLSAMLAFALANPITESRGNANGWVAHSWKDATVRQRPELVRDAYAAMARVKLERGEQIADGLRELLTEAALAPFRETVLLEFLRDFPNASPIRLDELMHAAVATPAAHPEFLILAGQVMQGSVRVDEQQRDIWLAAAYTIAPATFEAEVAATAAARPGFVFELRDRTGFKRRSQRNEQMPLPVPQLEFLARVTGMLHPAASHPSGGWSGNTNAWDASEYFYALVNAISAMPSEAATAALTRLEAHPQLASYRPHLLHSLANQRARRREAEYDRPDWDKTIAAFANGAPATASDLHAVLVAHLDEIRKRIASDNTDLFKAFWNIDQYARPVDPRPEEACRDTLLGLLRTGLQPLGIIVEPEGHMAGDRRADISVAMPGRKILCELKRDYHADVWTAAEEQLERFYTPDPEAQGFGVYAVFWFGDKRPRPIPAPPGGVARPQSAAEMEAMLRGVIPAERTHRIAVVVIDVSGPAD
jgi:predicted NACHT family NTPase